MASPCAACKFLRRKCTTGCVFAPYFPPDNPSKFANVHKIFGASNVSKLLNELPPHQREEAVEALEFEANARIRDPVYGCVACIAHLQGQIRQAQNQLISAKEELSRYTGSSAYSSFQPQPPLLTQNHSATAMPVSYMTGPNYGLVNAGIGMDLGLGTSADMPSHSGVVQVEVQQHLLAMENLRQQNKIRCNGTFDGMRGGPGGYSGHFNANLAASMQGAAELLSHQPAQLRHQHQHQNPQPAAQHQEFDTAFLARTPHQQQVHLETQQQTQPQVPPQLQLLYWDQMKQQEQHRRVGGDEGMSCIRPNSLP